MRRARDLGQEVGTKAACEALEVPRASYYRWVVDQDHPKPKTTERPLSHRALSTAEREHVLETLHSERFVDCAPREVYAALLDEGIYLCSIRTMYRILAQEDEVGERRNQLRHPNYAKPQLLALAPNQVWSWDITKLRGPVKWRYFYLYVIMDIFSRYVVGWMVADRELASLASRLIEKTVEKQGVEPDQVTLHSDRGPSMTSKCVGHLLAALGVTKSLSRPHVSNDNPYSEAQFKTLKYCPTFPARFGSIEDATAFCRPFFAWYNSEHYHTGLGLHTPESVHYGQVESIHAQRKAVLLEAYHGKPERFVSKIPTPAPLPEAAWINPPTTERATLLEVH